MVSVVLNTIGQRLINDCCGKIYVQHKVSYIEHIHASIAEKWLNNLNF